MDLLIAEIAFLNYEEVQRELVSYIISSESSIVIPDENVSEMTVVSTYKHKEVYKILKMFINLSTLSTSSNLSGCKLSNFFCKKKEKKVDY